MPEMMDRLSTPARRKTTIGYIVILACGFLMINAAAFTYGSNVTDIYTSATSIDR